MFVDFKQNVFDDESEVVMNLYKLDVVRKSMNLKLLTYLSNYC